MGLSENNAATTAVAETTIENTPPATTFPREVSFRFNMNKETNIQRAPVALKIPVPALPGIIGMITAGAKASAKAEADRGEDEKKAVKILDFIISTLGDTVVSEVRGHVSDNLKASQDTVEWDKFTFQAIALMPAGIRGASSIAKELWDKFAKVYTAYFSANGVTAETAATRVGVLVNKFRPLTGNPERKAIIENLMATVAVFVDKAGDVDEFGPILEFLMKKSDELKAEDNVVTKSALGFN